MIAAWEPLNTWIVVIGVLAAVACGLLGNFMVLRRMSMMGDAISHAVLPGLAVAFLISGSRDSATMFIGAALVGVLTALLTQFIHEWGRVDTNASMGVVFTTLFAIGLILIVRAASSVDLDPGCVLYGAIELAPLDQVTVLGLKMPRAAFILGVFALVNAGFVTVFYKELKITSFDPELATTVGIRAGVMHYLLMALIAATTVAAFEAVGSILVVAMLIVPGATAHLLTDRLPTMLLVSVIVAAVGAAAGHVAAITVPTWFGFPDTHTAGAMAVTTGLLFLLALLFAPRHGALSRVLHRTALGIRIVAEDLLGLLYRLEEHEQRDQPLTALLQRLRAARRIGPISARLALATLSRGDLIHRSGAGVRLTDAGRRRAGTLVRSHRLWESYLVKHLALPPDHVHPTAMELEHFTGPAMREGLSAEADHPEVDPHGAAIPPPATEP